MDSSGESENKTDNHRTNNRAAIITTEGRSTGRIEISITEPRFGSWVRAITKFLYGESQRDNPRYGSRAGMKPSINNASLDEVVGCTGGNLKTSFNTLH